MSEDWDEEFDECLDVYGDHDWTEPEVVEINGEKIARRKCKRCGLVEEELLIVKYWKNKFIEVCGKKYKALKAWANVSICSECGKPVFEPLILWDSKDTSKALTFHIECAKKIGIFKAAGLEVKP